MHLYHDSAFVLSTLFLYFCHVFLRQILKHNLVDIVSFILYFHMTYTIFLVEKAMLLIPSFLFHLSGEICFPYIHLFEAVI